MDAGAGREVGEVAWLLARMTAALEVGDRDERVGQQLRTVSRRVLSLPASAARSLSARRVVVEMRTAHPRSCMDRGLGPTPARERVASAIHSILTVRQSALMWRAFLIHRRGHIYGLPTVKG